MPRFGISVIKLTNYTIIVRVFWSLIQAQYIILKFTMKIYKYVYAIPNLSVLQLIQFQI